MSTDYEIWLTRDDGTRLTHLNDNGGFSYTWVANNIGTWSLTLPPTFDPALVRVDNRVQFWRKPAGGAQGLDFQGLVRLRETSTDDSGRTVRTIGGYDFIGAMLDGRIADYNSVTAWAAQDEALNADSWLELLAASNGGTQTQVAARTISTAYYTVAAVTASGPDIRYAVAYDNVLGSMRDVVAAARAAGEDIYFDIVPSGTVSVQFRVYIGLRGQDRTGTGGLVFSERRGNLRNPKLTEDLTSEVNVGYALGQGDGFMRPVQSYADTTRSTRSIWGRREKSVNASGQVSGSVESLLTAAEALVVSERPRAVFTAELVSLDDAARNVRSLYGRDWGRGDKVTVDFDGRQFPLVVRAVTVAVDANKEETVNVTGEAYL